MHIISRSEAKELGLKRYFTGKPCANGHTSERRCASGACLQCQKMPEAIEAMRICSNRHYEQNKEKILLQHAEWRNRNKGYSSKHYEKNKDKYRAMSAQNRVDNLDAYRAKDRNRRARKSRAQGDHSKSDILKIMRAQKYKCANCKCCLKKSGYHVDHIMPLARGGSNWPINLQCLCPTCNLKKNAKDPILWAQENGRLL